MECVRDVLLCIEEHTGLRTYCQFIDVELSHKVAVALGDTPKEIPDYQCSLMASYDNTTLIYHVRYCINAELVYTSETPSDEYCICDLTPKGHDFVENIRAPKNWLAIKKHAATIGSKSLDVLIQIAATVISNRVSSLG